MEFKNVSAQAKANIYFEGKVVSHGITLEDGTTKSFGIIYPGEYHFGTEAAERMDVTSGSCSVKIDGSEETAEYKEGSFFNIGANSGFTITVESGLFQYVCSYIKE